MATKLSEHFTYEEFISSSTASKYKINNEMGPDEYYNAETLCNEILEPIREKLGMPIIITSGYRCRELNKKVNGSPTSQHVDGTAADIHCKNMLKMWEVIIDMIKNEEIECGQLINEFNLSWIHISLPTRGKLNEVLKATKQNGKTVYSKLKI